MTQLQDDEFAAQARPLLEAARAGVPDAMGQLIEICRRYLLVVARSELSDAIQGKVGASDLVQDTLLEGVRQFTRFTGDTIEQLRAWLVAILRNKAANVRQFYQRDRRAVHRENTLTGTDSTGGGTDPRAPGETPSAEVAAAEQLQQVLRALKRLPELQQQVIRWRSWEEVSFAEIGNRIGRSEDAARMIWARAVAQLRVELGALDTHSPKPS